MNETLTSLIWYTAPIGVMAFVAGVWWARRQELERDSPEEFSSDEE